MIAGEKKAIVMNREDNVATVLVEVKKNERVAVAHDKNIVDYIVAQDDIDIYHKFAIKPIGENENVLKYGENIGKAIEPIELGCHVHVTNIKGVTLKK